MRIQRHETFSRYRRQSNQKSQELIFFLLLISIVVEEEGLWEGVKGSYGVRLIPLISVEDQQVVGLTVDVDENGEYEQELEILDLLKKFLHLVEEGGLGIRKLERSLDF